jgi:hypothetical protein
MDMAKLKAYQELKDPLQEISTFKMFKLDYLVHFDCKFGQFD